jgi:hypothetical protein
MVARDKVKFRYIDLSYCECGTNEDQPKRDKHHESPETQDDIGGDVEKWRALNHGKLSCNGCGVR